MIILGDDPSSLERSPSKLRLLRHRHRVFGELEQRLVAEIVFGADPFFQRAVDFSPAGLGRPGLFERARIGDGDDGFERAPVGGYFPAFDDMQILGVRRRVAVDDAVLVLDETDRVDDEFAILVTADGFAEPGWFEPNKRCLPSNQLPKNLIFLMILNRIYGGYCYC